MVLRIPSLKELFFTFLKVGILSVGGGYAMLTIMEQDVVERKKWVTHELFLEAVTVGQSSPGVMITNIGAFIAYRLHGTTGMLTAIVALVLPGFIIVLGLAALYVTTAHLTAFQAILKGVAPAVVGLFFGMTLRLVKSNLRSWMKAIIALLACIAVLVHIHPILIIIVVGISALLWTYLRPKLMKG